MTQSIRQGTGGVLGLAVLTLLAGGPVAQAQELRFPLGIRGQFSTRGMLVQVVTPGSPAEAGGLQRGDLITKVDGVTITNQADLVRVVNTSGGMLTLNIVRGGQPGRVNLDLRGGGGLPPGAGLGVPAPFLLGVQGLFRPEGMLVKVVGPGTPAARAGIQPNDVIVRINNALIRNQRDLFVVLNNSNGTAVLDVRRAGAVRPVRVVTDLRVFELGAVGEFLPQGMRIRVVSPGTPADRAGLVAGDVIVQIDQRVIRSQADFDAALRASTGAVVLGVRKFPRGVAVRLPVELMNNQLGVWCEPGTDGVRILSVPPGSPGSQLGLERGDFILRVDRARIRDNRELIQALKESGGVTTLVVRQGSTGRVVRLDAVLGW